MEQPRLKARVVLTEYEQDLQQKYQLLETAPVARVAAVNSDQDKAKLKAELVAQAAERERRAAAMRERNLEAKRKKAALLAAPSASESMVSVSTAVKRPLTEEGGEAETSNVAAVTVAAIPSAPKRAAPAREVKKDWDVKNPGWPFEGLPLMEHVDLVQNPHLAQNDVGFFRVPMEQMPLALHPAMNRMPYVWVPKNKRSVQHIGVRKLLMQEIDFLREYGAKDTLVVYVGAAPGTHMKVLTDYFPEMSFLLIDTGRFLCEASSRVAIWQQHDAYSENVLMEVRARKERKIFISDMYTANATERADVDQYVAADMERQMEWHLRLDVDASLLKFRLPWEEGSTTYLDGQLFFTCYGPSTTTETRLLVKRGAEKKVYDHKLYEEQMFYFNRMVRVQYYDHDVVCPEFDHCFDCARTVLSLGRYLEHHNSWYTGGERNGADNTLLAPIPHDELNREIVARNAQITKTLSVKMDPAQQQQQQLQQQQQRMLMEKMANDEGDKKSEEAVAASKEGSVPDTDEPVRAGGAADEEVDYGDLME